MDGFSDSRSSDPTHAHHCTSLCLQGSVSLRNPLRFSDPQAKLYRGLSLSRNAPGTLVPGAFCCGEV